MKEIKKKRYIISCFIYFSVCILTLTDIMKFGINYLKNHFAQSNIYMEMLIGFVTLIIFFVVCVVCGYIYYHRLSIFMNEKKD